MRGEAQAPVKPLRFPIPSFNMAFNKKRGFFTYVIFPLLLGGFSASYTIS